MNLGQNEFATALARGSGRAMVLLRQSTEKESFREALVHACLRNVAYDPQCEDERCKFLARLIFETGDEVGFFTALVPRLTDDGIDVLQLFGVLAQLAAKCGDLQKLVVRRAYARLSDDDQFECLDALVRLDGLPALIRGVERFVDICEDEGWRARSLLDSLREHGEIDPAQLLLSASAEYPQLERFIDCLRANQQPMPNAADETYEFAAIRAGLQLGQRPPGAWLRKLSEDEWRNLAEDFELQTEESSALQYLRLFQRRPYPNDPRHMFQWMRSSNLRVLWSTAAALGRIESPLVRDIALGRIQNGDPIGVRLLVSNYKFGDMRNIFKLLSGLSRDHEIHDLGLSVLDLVERNDISSNDSRDVLLLLYEKTPCSMCRRYAVEQLAKAGSVPSWIVEECRFDADQDTAKLFDAKVVQ